VNFEQNTGRTIQDAFELFHKANPHVYAECKKLAFDAINRGRKAISFKLIINVVRWERFMRTEEPTLFNQDGVQIAFKINDAYSSRYARLFAEEHPEHKDKIEFRTLRSEKGQKSFWGLK